MIVARSTRRAAVLVIAVIALTAGCGGGGDTEKTPAGQKPLESTLKRGTANTTSPRVSTPSNSPSG